MKKIIVLLKFFGSLLIIFATLILTVKIYSIEDNLSDIKGEILSHKNSVINIMQIISDIRELFTHRRLDLLEHNNLITNKFAREKDLEGNIFMFSLPAKPEENILLADFIRDFEKDIFNATKNIIKSWNALLENPEKSKQEWEKLNTKLDEIIKDPDMTFTKKLKKLDGKRDEEAAACKERIKNYHKKLEIYRTNEKELKDDKTFWNGLFIWLQVLGLITLGISEILLIINIRTS